MDSPHRQRPLAGVDQALGEGGARQPTELLGQLRDRLARLDENHPSATRGPADSRELAASGEAAAPEEAAASEAAVMQDRPTPGPGSGREASEGRTAGRPDRPARADSGHDGGQASGDQPAGATDSSPRSSESTRAWTDDAAAAGTDPGPGQSEASPTWERRPASGDPYRPWFAADDPTTPWFAE